MFSLERFYKFCVKIFFKNNFKSEKNTQKYLCPKKKCWSKRKYWVWKNFGPQKFWFNIFFEPLKFLVYKVWGLEKNLGFEKKCWKKIWGPNKFWVRKTLLKKILGPKKFWSEKNVEKKLGFQKMLGPKEIWVQFFLGLNKISGLKALGPNKNLFCPGTFRSTKIMTPKKLGPKPFVKIGSVIADILLLWRNVTLKVGIC